MKLHPATEIALDWQEYRLRPTHKGERPLIEARATLLFPDMHLNDVLLIGVCKAPWPFWQKHRFLYFWEHGASDLQDFLMPLRRANGGFWDGKWTDYVELPGTGSKGIKIVGNILREVEVQKDAILTPTEKYYAEHERTAKDTCSGFEGFARGKNQSS